VNGHEVVVEVAGRAIHLTVNALFRWSVPGPTAAANLASDA
jgi:hypothetical protein